MCERLDKRASFRFSQVFSVNNFYVSLCVPYADSFSLTHIHTQIEDGDIICFQKSPPPETDVQVRFPDVPSYLEYVKNRQVDITPPLPSYEFWGFVLKK